jgi:hypothetical protein
LNRFQSDRISDEKERPKKKAPRYEMGRLFIGVDQPAMAIRAILS